MNQGLLSLLRANSVLRAVREPLKNLKTISISPHRSLARQIKTIPDLAVLDIGANVGQFGIDLRRAGFCGSIVSFEPVHNSYTKLQRVTRKDQLWKTYCMALGSSERFSEINVTKNSGLSTSFYPMLKIHLDNFPESEVVSKEKVFISTVDAQIENLGLNPSKVVIKLDVQGYEFEVLKGAKESLSRIPFCFLEVSLFPLYEGERTLLPILNLLAASGHEVFDVFRGVTSKEGELLQVDILTRVSNSRIKDAL